MSKIEFTDAELREINAGLNCTFGAIAYDLLACNKSIPRDEVIEVVLDSDFLESYGNLDKTLVKVFRMLSYDEQIKIAKDTFPARWYSL